MSETKEGRASSATQITDFILAKVGGKLLRFAAVESVPEGAETITLESVQELPKDKIGELYGTVAGVSPKHFKDKRMAIESLIYQVAKMPIYDPSAVKPEAKPGEAKKTAAGEKFVRKSNETFELLTPPDTEKVLRDLAPQARELILIMTELAKEKGSTTFSGSELNSKLKIPEVGARLRTKQDPLRILQYYKGKLIGAGLVRTS
jgi:hypothetical protein